MELCNGMQPEKGLFFKFFRPIKTMPYKNHVFFVPINFGDFS
jgi:hypothetical protein